MEFSYTVRLSDFAFPEFTRAENRRSYYQAEVDIDGEPQESDLTGSSQEQIIHDLLEHYESHMQLLQQGHG